MEKEKESFDFERFKEEAISGLYASQKLHGDKGVFGRLIKHPASPSLHLPQYRQNSAKIKRYCWYGLSDPYLMGDREN